MDSWAEYYPVTDEGVCVTDLEYLHRRVYGPVDAAVTNDVGMYVTTGDRKIGKLCDSD